MTISVSLTSDQWRIIGDLIALAHQQADLDQRIAGKERPRGKSAPTGKAAVYSRLHHDLCYEVDDLEVVSDSYALSVGCDDRNKQREIYRAFVTAKAALKRYLDFGGIVTDKGVIPYRFVYRCIKSLHDEFSLSVSDCRAITLQVITDKGLIAAAAVGV